MDYSVSHKFNCIENRFIKFQTMINKMQQQIDESKNDNKILLDYIEFKLDKDEFERFKNYQKLKKEFEKEGKEIGE